MAFFVGFFWFFHFIHFLLLFHKSNFYVLVIVSVVLGFLGFVMCYHLDLCFCFWFLFFGRVKGQVRWPKGPPHLALNHPYLFFFGLFLVCFCFVLFCFFFVFAFVFLEGFKGQVTIPEGPPHLAITLLICFLLVLVCFWFVFVLEGAKTFFPPKKGIVAHLFSV